jgi:large subunit ribosomal protein L15
MILSALKPNWGANRPSKKVGRGNGSGHGRTSCRGSNGANCRSGATREAHFEGGQMPLQRRLPKRGFRNFFSLEYTPVNLGDVDAKLGSTGVVDNNFLAGAGLIKSADEQVKILGTGEITKAVTWKGLTISKAASDKIAKSGGKIDGGKITQYIKPEKPVKPPPPAQPAKPEKAEKPEKGPKAEKQSKPEKAEKQPRPEKPEKKKGPEAPAKE